MLFLVKYNLITILQYQLQIFVEIKLAQSFKYSLRWQQFGRLKLQNVMCAQSSCKKMQLYIDGAESFVFKPYPSMSTSRPKCSLYHPMHLPAIFQTGSQPSYEIERGDSESLCDNIQYAILRVYCLELQFYCLSEKCEGEKV